MPEPRPEEEWARVCIERALGDEVEVSHHDDGSADSMYDIAVANAGDLVAAVEVTGVWDPPVDVLWKLLNSDGRWIDDRLAGGWIVGLKPGANAKRIRANLPAFLQKLESVGVRNLLVAPWGHGPFDNEAEQLGIIHLHQGATAFPGSIYPLAEQEHDKTGGYVADTGDALPRWLGWWLRDPVRADNVRKLSASGAPEHHMFVVFPPFADAPFGVTDLLMRRDAPLPTLSPDLPDEVTHASAASAWGGGAGMRWSPDAGWHRFATH